MGYESFDCNQPVWNCLWREWNLLERRDWELGRRDGGLWHIKWVYWAFWQWEPLDFNDDCKPNCRICAREFGLEQGLDQTMAQFFVSNIELSYEHKCSATSHLTQSMHRTFVMYVYSVRHPGKGAPGIYKLPGVNIFWLRLLESSPPPPYHLPSKICFHPKMVCFFAPFFEEIFSRLWAFLGFKMTINYLNTQFVDTLISLRWKHESAHVMCRPLTKVLILCNKGLVTFHHMLVILVGCGIKITKRFVSLKKW